MKNKNKIKKYIYIFWFGLISLFIIFNYILLFDK
jgi:hypothetical protein